MINYNSKHWFSFIFSFKASIIKPMLTSLAFVTLYTWGLVYFIEEYDRDGFKITTTVHSLLGIVLGLLLVFRTNTAYERWWEGRKILGALLDSSRNLAIKLNAFLPENDHENRRFFAKIIPAYAFSMKEHLRRGVKFDELEGLDPAMIEDLKTYQHVPNRVATILYEKIQEIHAKTVFDQSHLINLDVQTKILTDCVGGCERIKKTPLPFDYSIHLKRFIFIYILTLPLALIHELGYYTIPAVVFIFYAMVGIELIGEEIEDPFGTDANDLPSDDICAAIRSNVHEILRVS